MDSYQILALVVAGLGSWLVVSAFLRPRGVRRSPESRAAHILGGAFLVLVGGVAYFLIGGLDRALTFGR